VALREHLNRLCDCGHGVYVASPGSGEVQSLTRDELGELYRTVVKLVGGRTPVWSCGVEPRSARELVGVGELATEAGLEGMMMYPIDRGHGITPTPAELERYYTDVLERVRIPVVLSLLSRGYKVPLALVRMLTDKYEHLVGINVYDSASLIQVHRVLEGRLKIYAGNANVLLNLALGGHGFSSAEGNVVPALTRSVLELWTRGDARGSCEAFANVQRLQGVLAPLSGGPTKCKTALRLLGLSGGKYLRPPYLRPDPEVEAKVAEGLAELRIAEFEQAAAERLAG
jgi:dihydrodipicolinate synthase/N-acetylneuraminate lyase